MEETYTITSGSSLSLWELVSLAVMSGVQGSQALPPSLETDGH